MTTGKAVLAIRSGRPPGAPANRLRIWWTGIALLIAGGLFLQAGFAGAMLSGSAFALGAHKLTASILIAATLVSSLVATVSLRRIENGTRFGVTLLVLALALALQFAVGKLSANGANLLWLHVPLGVALVGLAAHAIRGARRLSAHDRMN
ncbi:MAG: hypothetical protein P4L72_09910 [Parvibaculum sp.]|uniref:hypothetical protein n=1 Tax=Parvibaculum sp. TaxID=2024848 RepID=UPI0028449004|nr:hypothetical protein [Parvibaculum sp.]MDR3499528.1 hypothetical protein [Parvibaculum sp.]